MPEIRHYKYKVTQTREVNVTANSAGDAARIASVAFEHGQNRSNGVFLNETTDSMLTGIYGNTSSRITERSLDIVRTS